MAYMKTNWHPGMDHLGSFLRAARGLQMHLDDSLDHSAPYSCLFVQVGLVGVLIIGVVLYYFEAYIRAPDVWKLPYEPWSRLLKYAPIDLPQRSCPALQALLLH